jgi:hypothetical protein
MDNVFVIGDVHGNLDRLEALLRQEGLLDRCEACKGSGMRPSPPRPRWVEDDNVNYDGITGDCRTCKGLGWARLHPEVTVVQLGDLAHLGHGGSPTGDLLCYKYVTENDWCDVVLWGNHDRAMVDKDHAFTGFQRNMEVGEYIAKLFEQGRLQTAFEAHGFLLTHAGLALAFGQQKVDDKLKYDESAFVEWINDQDELWLGKDEAFAADTQAVGIVNAIGRKRGGTSAVGGILWRDIEEGLYDGFRQIFGHSADDRKHQVRYAGKRNFTRKPPENWTGSYCIDVGGKPGRPNKNGYNPNTLAGIWLPSEKIAKVEL